MYKGIEWLKEEIGELPCVDTVFNSDGSSYIDSAVPVMAVYDLIDKLDEPEVLSHKWISDHIIFNEKEDAEYVYADELQNLLVPKQEELESKIKVLIEAYKQEDGAYSNPENGWIGGFIEDLKSLVEEEQKYYVLLGNQLHDDNWTYALTNLGSIEVIEKDVLPEWDRTKLTEQEIKDYDERYWAFAEPVEEMEE